MDYIKIHTKLATIDTFLEDILKEIKNTGHINGDTIKIFINEIGDKLEKIKIIVLNKGDILQIVNEKGIPFNVRLIKKGDKYGRSNRLTHDEEEPLVEFYDARYINTDFGQLGQFVSRYYLSTIMEHEEDCGLILEGGVADWVISAENVEQVKQWLNDLKVV
jgi:hypothetical protein